MYIREPIYVWGVNETDAAYAQQYSYQTFTIPNSDAHQTGVVAAVEDERVSNILEFVFTIRLYLSC